MAKWYGSNFPFYRNSGLVADRQEDSRLIKNDFIQGIMTLTGERWFRPGFGGNIKSFVFDPNDSSSRTQLEESIRRQTATFHPRITLTKLEVKEADNNPNVVLVNVYGRTVLDATNVETLLIQFHAPVAGTVGSNAGNNIGEVE